MPTTLKSSASTTIAVTGPTPPGVMPMDEALPAERLAPVVQPPAFLRRACAYIERRCDEDLRIEDVAAFTNVSASTLRRGFARALGVSPKAFHAACRTARLKGELRAGQSVTDAIFAAGYSSASRVYEGSDDKLGMTPGQYKRLGEGLHVSYASCKTSLGTMVLAATDRGICFLHFGRHERSLVGALEQEFAAARSIEKASDSRVLQTWMSAVRAFIDDMTPLPDLPLHVLGTAYQRRVWRFLQTVPAGQTMSYGEVAKALGNRDGARAVATACAKNNVAVLVPCHRVVRKNGNTGGYRFGPENKRRLLLRERQTFAPDLSLRED